MPPAASYERLSRSVSFDDVEAPVEAHFDLPETMLQFGTGAFLRGFVEWFVDEANRAGRALGRAVLVSSTGSGRAARLSDQDHLYTLCVRGLDDGERVDRSRVIPVVSRALSARDDWPSVLAFARSPDLWLVTSNTTEVGITLDANDRHDADPPRSFPGKLTAVLYERARAFDYDPQAGLVVLPCELIERNGDTLRDIVLTLADRWALGDAFADWVRSATVFCNTLVDRIVPGQPEPAERESLFGRLRYADDLLTVAEPYRLWAIEASKEARARLEPLAGLEGIEIVDDGTPYRVRKVRILNGAHTISVPAAYLCGCTTVREAVEDPDVGAFIRRVMLREIVPSLDLPAGMATAFAHAVLERFANPFIRHELLDITFQQTTKMRVRVVPSLLDYTRKNGSAPESMAFGFACFLLFQHEAHRPDDDELPRDEARSYWCERWRGVDLNSEKAVQAFVEAVAADEERWGPALQQVPGFVEAVSTHLRNLIAAGPREALRAHLAAVSE